MKYASIDVRYCDGRSVRYNGLNRDWATVSVENFYKFRDRAFYRLKFWCNEDTDGKTYGRKLLEIFFKDIEEISVVHA